MDAKVRIILRGPELNPESLQGLRGLPNVEFCRGRFTKYPPGKGTPRWLWPDWSCGTGFVSVRQLEDETRSLLENFRSTMPAPWEIQGVETRELDVAVFRASYHIRRHGLSLPFNPKIIALLGELRMALIVSAY